MSLSILVGLGLDYDVFLFMRVMEYREAGFSTGAAMRKGVYKTGYAHHFIAFFPCLLTQCCVEAFACLISSTRLTLGVHGFRSVITTAGIIMVIAFGGMQFSSSMVLNQFSTMLFVCVLVDTFLVRTTLVPAIVALADDWNWYALPTALFMMTGRVTTLSVSY
jgi:uncharacterized membrane protein YdfJ with MMPL/SSD domain